MFRTTIVTPGSTAFDSSVTAPEIVPVVAWACTADGAVAGARMKKPTVARMDSRMSKPPFGPTICWP